MKKALLFFLSMIVLATAASAQKKKKEEAPVKEPPQMPMENGLIVFSGSAESEHGKAVLFEKARAWFKGYYKNPAEVLKEQDATAGVIMGRGRLMIYSYRIEKGDTTLRKLEGFVQYTIKITVEDKRYSYRIERINWKQASYYGIEKWYDKSSAYYRTDFVDFLEQTDSYMKELIADFTAAIGKQK